MTLIGEARAMARDTVRVMRHPDARGAVLLYAVLAVVLFTYSFLTAGLLTTLVSAAVGVALLPFVEFVVHKYLLHLLEFAKNPILAQIWNRVHYAHHMEPKDTTVILAHPASALFLVAVLGGGAWLVEPASVPPVLAVSLLLFAFYEVVHFSCHMDGEMASRYFSTRRQAHALHHYLDENRNFGITTGVADRLFGTGIGDRTGLKRSPTVRNLGYFGAFAERYPYLKRRPGRGENTEA
ncbi:sterol desaturase family protein [Aquabacter spiritensis]|uniref:Sterol desaturase/sphingolipid hydroxylase (Fatty acid hydroxylase superfamily) n=1 Tax=Aquabacter spiritensis TaxID=933073 RepID=A0A4R3LP50_9HYPH|nr:sterol desaturase family protein [Aquabacter spiritensis]TCT02253.1 sterol desaturase/sphingolipid hydroxylase (fatty acid hydroxylase superfamily) [Aquabacter spiritensis]